MAAFTTIATIAALGIAGGSMIAGAKAPKVSGKAAEGVEASARKTKKARTALYETEGGQAGQELEAGGVTKRNTLLGN